MRPGSQQGIRGEQNDSSCRLVVLSHQTRAMLPCTRRVQDLPVLARPVDYSGSSTIIPRFCSCRLLVSSLSSQATRLRASPHASADLPHPLCLFLPLWPMSTVLFRYPTPSFS
eukprot:274653-Hanusia_phi.AAC.1